MLADALSYNDEADVERWFERYRRMTGRDPLVYRSTIDDVRTFKKVPNEPFREAYIRLSDPEGREYHEDVPWLSLFRDELKRVRKMHPYSIGPSDLGSGRLTAFLRDVLGITARRQHGYRGSPDTIALAWLVQYEVAEALCKALGLIPHQVGI
jgi:hypothetical protein